MSTFTHLYLPAAAGATSQPGHWKLGPGQTLTLKPRAAARLRVAQGGLWLTLDGSGCGLLDGLGDWFIEAGQSFTVPAGRRAVIEPWGREAGAGSHFSWAWADSSELIRAAAGSAAGVRLHRSDKPVRPGARAGATGWQAWLGAWHKPWSASACSEAVGGR